MDTGSGASLVNEAFVKEAALGEEVRSCDTKLKSFTGNPIGIKGQITLDVTIGGYMTRHSYLITEGMETDVLVGADYLRESDITLNMGKGFLQLPNERRAEFLQLPSPLRKSMKIRVAKTTVIQPNTVQFMKGKMEEWGAREPCSREKLKGRYSGVIEPHQLHTNYCRTSLRGIAIPRMAVYSKNGEVPLKCINLEEQPVTLYKNSFIAVMQPLNCGWESIMSNVAGLQLDEDSNKPAELYMTTPESRDNTTGLYITTPESRDNTTGLYMTTPESRDNTTGLYMTTPESKDNTTGLYMTTPEITGYELANHETEKAGPGVKSWTRETLFKELKMDQITGTRDEISMLEDVMWKNKEVFSRNKHDIGKGCNFFEAEIQLKEGYEPQWVPCRPTPYKQREALNKELQRMINAGVVEDCNEPSNWQSPVFLVKKPGKPGEWRWILDARKINGQSVPDNYPLPNINHVVDAVGGKNYYSTMDLSQSFFQVNLDKKSRPITAFSINQRRLMYRKMIMGHCNSSQQFSRCMSKLLASIPIEELIAFLDDLLLASDTVEEHIQRLDMVLTRFREAEMKLSPGKCAFLQKEVQYVGLCVSKKGLRITDERVEAVKQIQRPSSLKETQSVLGFLNYNRKFVKNFAARAKPLYELLEKKSQKAFMWNERCEEALEDIKQEIAKGITLCIPDVEDPLNSYQVTIDASNNGLGAELTQIVEGERRLLAYFSRAVPKHKKSWGQTRLEFLALHAALKHWEIYLKGANSFKVLTDCESLLNLDTLFANCNALMTRKIQTLAGFRFRLGHIAGKSNDTADFLSRYLHKNRGRTIGTQTGQEGKDSEKKESVTTQMVGEERWLNNSKESWIEMIRKKSKEEQRCWLKKVEERFETRKREEHTEVKKTTARSNPNSHLKIKESRQAKQRGIDQGCTCRDNARGRLRDLMPQKMPVSPEQGTEIRAVVCNTEKGTRLSLERIKGAQEEDDIIQEVLGWVKENKKPETLQAVGAPNELVSFWKTFKTLSIEDGVLKRKWYERATETERLLIVIPNDLREEIMKECHVSKLAAHPGVDNSCNLCRRSYYWPRMRDDFELFIAACIVCGSVKQPQAYLRAPLKHLIFHQFNDCVVIDHIVPKQEGRTVRGNRYILTITDMWSGFCLAFPCRTQEAKETVDLIIKRWIGILGFPIQILADQAGGFTSHFFKEVLRLLEIRLSLGQRYSCRSTAKAERTNKRVNVALRAAMENENMGRWDDYLCYVVFALNSLKSRHTGFSANKLVYGKELNTPSSLLIENQEMADSGILNQHATKAYEMVKDMKRIGYKVRRAAKADYGYSDAQWDKKLKGPYFAAGDFCYTLLYLPRECPKHKFAYRWSGPNQVIKVVNERLYVVKMKDTGEERVFSLEKLKHYKVNKFSPVELQQTRDEWGEEAAEDELEENTEEAEDVENGLGLLERLSVTDEMSMTEHEPVVPKEGECPRRKDNPEAESDKNAASGALERDLVQMAEESEGDIEDGDPTVPGTLPIHPLPVRRSERNRRTVDRMNYSMLKGVISWKLRMGDG